MKSRVLHFEDKGVGVEVLVTIWEEPAYGVDCDWRDNDDPIWREMEQVGDVTDETDGDPPEPLVTTG